ncbi:hypothetical protein EUTSA_v10002806mg [Eutrema salsugineum]|uniref:DUF4283 domain-containing protein n=1 Tax=Eutrema salsugineum TaxID=72664 RepID=V4LAY4_EUTSA|nr:uncharacterized protein LOC18013942 [Eutrema salsugineum]ESQ36943.1 hypothetical protein EUTSA_v10002806mg [Eutrema salsugineum]
MDRRYSREEKGKDIVRSHHWIREPPIKLPDEANPALIEANKLTLIGRVLNPAIQKQKNLVSFMPQVWRMEDRITGRDLGPEKFQFKLKTEADLQAVLSEAPFNFKRWMFVLQRWEPIISEAFPSKIPFWVRVHGIPSHCCTENNLKAIGNVLGTYDNHDIEDAAVRVYVNGLKPLIQRKSIQFSSGVEVSVIFEYTRLEKHCFICMSMSHEKEDCPQANKSSIRESPNSHINNQQTLQRLEADRQRKEDRKALPALTSSDRAKQRVDRSAEPRYGPSHL